MKLSVFSFLCVALGFCSGQAKAATVFSNGVPDLTNAYNMSDFRIADNFTLGGSATVTAVRFWAVSVGSSFSSAFDGSVTWAIYNDSSGSLGTLVSSGTVGSLVGVPDGTLVLSTFPVNVIDFNLGSPQALSAGTYWLELHEGTSLTTSDATAIFWATSNGSAGDAKQDFNPTLPSTGQNVELAFQLFDNTAPSVPEPTTWVLLAAPLAAMLWFRRRRA
jgi:hypothetical protein